MTVAISNEGVGFLAIEIDGVASTDNAGQGSLANPFGCTVNILRAYLVTSVVSTGASDLSIGVTTAAAAATDILNALDVNGVTVDRPYNCFANDPGAKTITVPAAWTAAKYLTFTASATMVGYVGTLYLEVLRTTVENA
jgi:hypothetical protein